MYIFKKIQSEVNGNLSKIKKEMKNVAVPSIILLMVCWGVMHVYNMYHHQDLTIERAVDPVQHLSDARHAIVNNNYHRSIKELEDAMMAMRIIEQYADSAAAEHIEKAIDDLMLVEEEVKNDSVIVDDLNKAFFNALNSIAYANLTISEASLDKGEKYKAMQFMNATFSEMIGSLKFADEKSKKREEEVIDEIRSILSELKKSNYTYKFNYDSLNEEIEELIE